MTDYISREAAIIPSFRYQLPNGEMSPPVVFVKTLLHSIPAADVRPVVRGEWIWKKSGEVVCSKCNDLMAIVGNTEDLITVKSYHNFCPNCGADMR